MSKAKILIIGTSREEQDPGSDRPLDVLPMSSGTLRRYLDSAKKYDVREADTVIGAFTLLSVFRPDIIFISYRVKLITCMEAIRLLRADETTRSVPIVVATTMQLTTEEMTRICQTGVDLLELPGTPGIVLRTINRILRTEPKHVLVVDDDAEQLSLTVRLLDGVADHHKATREGAVALYEIRNGAHYDLLITDVVRPGLLNGIALAGIVRQLRPDLPTIFLTGGTPEVDVHQVAADLGVAAVIERPVDVDTFRSTVKAVLSGR